MKGYSSGPPDGSAKQGEAGGRGRGRGQACHALWGWAPASWHATCLPAQKLSCTLSFWGFMEASLYRHD